METLGCSGLSCSDRGPPSDPTNVQSGATGALDASTAPPAPPAKPECGAGSCLPDDTNACSDFVPPSPPVSGNPIDAGVAADAGGAEEALDAGVSDAGPEGPSIDGSFVQPARPEPGPARFACQLSVGSRGVARACGVAGSQIAEQACTSSLDCAPGLGCVGPAGSGRCLQYCCGVGSDDSCGAGFFCAQRPLHDGVTEDAPLVPVCDRADNCNLGQQKDCTGPSCVCGPDSACMLVRPGGTTACVELTPDPGQAGEACPCDRGYHCSQAEPATCVKTCDLDAKESDVCGSGVCQASPVLPTGWGICVGAAPEEMTSP